MKIVLAAFFLFAATVGSAHEIQVGKESITIPNPTEFSPVTAEMGALVKLLKPLIAPTNEALDDFIPEAEVPGALRGEIPNLKRRFSVQTAKKLTTAYASNADFLELKKVIRTQNKEMYAKVEKEMPGQMSKINQGLSQEYDINLALSVSQMVPLPVHAESARMIANSAIVKYNLNDEMGRPQQQTVVVTTTFVHVNGKVLFLYCNAEASDLEWTRENSKHWAQAILEANPAALQANAKETFPGVVAGFNWGEVGKQTLIGGVIGMIVGLLAWVLNRNKGRKNSQNKPTPPNEMPKN